MNQRYIPIFSEKSSIFLDYFLRKAKIEVALQLTEEILKKRGSSEHVIIAKNLVYLTLIYFQSSLQTSGSGFATSQLLNYAGISEENSEWIGFIVSSIVSLAIDSSLLNFSLSTLGGFAGKFFVRTSCEKIRDIVAPPSVEKECASFLL